MNQEAIHITLGPVNNIGKGQISQIKSELGRGGSICQKMALQNSRFYCTKNLGLGRFEYLDFSVETAHGCIIIICIIVSCIYLWKIAFKMTLSSHITTCTISASAPKKPLCIIIFLSKTSSHIFLYSHKTHQNSILKPR